MNIDEFSRIAVKHGLAQSGKNLQQYLRILFGDIDFKGKSMLDIGGGTGVFCHYAAFRGAERAVCMEPEDDGSTAGVTENFNTIRDEFQTGHSVSLDHRLFQEYEGEPFDIVLLHNVVNHLDEQACIDLLESAVARATFVELFEKLNAVVAPNGVVIICDCGRRNFFGDIGMTNPVMPTIEWEKHQQPAVWAELLEHAGFNVEQTKWNTFNSLGKLGPYLLGYFIPAYFSLSHFRLYARKPA